VTIVAVVGWQGVTTVGRDYELDARAHLEYAQYFSHHAAPPPRAQNYEFSNPPLFAILAVGVEKAVRVLPSHPVGFSSNALTRGVWLVLALAGALAMAAAGRRRRLAGASALFVSALWGIDETLSLGRSESWVSGQLVALAAAVGLVAVTVAIGRELWPSRPGLALATGALVALYPVSLRMGILFHPETTFALLAALAVLLTLRSYRRGWPPLLGAGVGVLCGLAAVTRASAPVVALAIALAVGLAGGRRARGFLLAGAGALALVATPWWVAAYHLWGNPLESNLNRPGYMLPNGQPASFYLGLPLRSLVLHPFRPDFQDQLWAKLHADLWSDWFGGLQQLWAHPSRLARVTASTQSVLGFAGDALALGGLALVGVPAALRVARRRAHDADLAWLLLAALGVVAFVAFVVQLVRFPQAEGDPIKASYLLFTAPCWAALSVAVWDRLRRRPRAAAAVAAVGVLYVVSYAATLGGAFS
jgi:4-amino-4-deoxy-L-arabinose transferase-like glycosyltransferase